MKGNITLRELYEQKQKRKHVLLTIFFIIVISTFLYGTSSYANIFSKKTKSIPSEKKNVEEFIIIGDDSLTNKSDSLNTSESNIEETTNDEKIIEKTTVKKITITENEPDTIENASEPSKPNYCSDNEISIYKQIISTSNSVIESANIYVSNPTCIYPYTQSACNLTYENCLNSVESWYQTDGTCSRLPRSGMCATLNQERYYRLQQCEENKISCNYNCETYKEQEILKRLSEIAYREDLIVKNEQKLLDCGVL